MRIQRSFKGVLATLFVAMAGACGGQTSEAPASGGAGGMTAAGGAGGGVATGGAGGSAVGGMGGAGGAAMGGLGGAAGAGGAGSAGGSGGGTGLQASGGCSASALTTCTGRTSGPWCVDYLLPPIQTSGENESVWSSGPDDTWVVGAESVPPTNTTTQGYAFHWDGCTWNRIPLPAVEPALHGVWGAAPNAVWAVGEHGLALEWTGSAWIKRPIGADVSLQSVSGTSNSDVWTSAGYHWNGARWTVPAGGGPTGTVWAVAPGDVWGTGGFSANAWHFDGATWTNEQAGSHPEFALFAIWADATTAWAVGEGQQIAHLANGAWTQVEQPGGSSEGYVGVMQSGSDVYAVGIGVAHSTAGGAFVQDPDAPGGVFYRSVWLTPSQVWVVGDAVVIHKVR